METFPSYLKDDYVFVGNIPSSFVIVTQPNNSYNVGSTRNTQCCKIKGQLGSESSGK